MHGAVDIRLTVVRVAGGAHDCTPRPRDFPFLSTACHIVPQLQANRPAPLPHASALLLSTIVPARTIDVSKKLIFLKCSNVVSPTQLY
jgi:hypothetical protein